MFYAFVAALCIAEYFHLLPPWTTAPFAVCSPERRRAFFVFALFSLPLAFALHLGILGEIERAQHLAGRVALPFPVIDFSSATLIASRAWFTPALFVVALIETVALIAVAHQLGEGRLSRIDGLLVGIACVLLATVALNAPALTDGDMYSYVGYDLLGWRAYSPPNAPFAGDFSAINALWGTPMPPAAYGPLWLAYNTWYLHWAETLVGKIHLLQAAGIAAIATLAILLRSCGLKPATCALVLLNPFLYLEFVTNGHNDLFPVILTAVAFAIARRTPYLAVPAAVAAGAMKVPFVVIGTLAFVIPTAPARRVALAALTTLCGIAIVCSFGAGIYAQALFSEASEGATAPWLRFTPPHIAAIAIALAAICTSLLGRRTLRSSALALSSLAAQRSAYYGVWCLPFALGDDMLMKRLLLCLPALGFFLQSVVDVRWYQFCMLAALLLLTVSGIIRRAKIARATSL